jgi:hypothetical protein
VTAGSKLDLILDVTRRLKIRQPIGVGIAGAVAATAETITISSGRWTR